MFKRFNQWTREREDTSRRTLGNCDQKNPSFLQKNRLDKGGSKMITETAQQLLDEIDTSKVKTKEERISEWYIESKIINTRVLAWN